MDNQTIAVIIVIAVSIAVISEIDKKFFALDAQQIHLLNLLLGIGGGIIAMNIFGGDFATNIFMGLAGAVTAPGVYELVTKLFKLDFGAVK